MRRARVWSIRTAVGLAAALAAAAAAQAQVPTVKIEDVWVVEANSDWSKQVKVTLSAQATSPIDIYWHTVDGSATSGIDFGPVAPGGGPIHFNTGDSEATLSVLIKGDSVDEWNPAHMDEAFFIDLELPPPAMATLLKSRATVTIIDDDLTLPGLQFVSAVADGSAALGRVRLHWRVPAASSTSGPVKDVLVRWNTGSHCPAPADAAVAADGQFYVAFDRGTAMNQAGDPQMVEHLIPNPPPFERHCYSLFTVYSQPGPAGTPTPERAEIAATPFDSGAGPLAWAYSTGFPNVVAPTVGQYAVYTVSTDGVVHAMERGGAGGQWPATWNPVALGKPAHNRSPVVPLPEGQRFFVGTESGEVHAVDGEDGAIVWSRSAPFGNELPNMGAVQGTPAGIFTGWGGPIDAILVGSYQATPNAFFMLDPRTGNPVSGAVNTFTDPRMGGMAGMAAVNYPPTVSDPGQVFFVTNSLAGTLWGLSISGTGFGPLAGPVALPGANGSPVTRNGRVYFGTTNGDVVAYRPASDQRSVFAAGDGEVKGFVFPDRRNNNDSLYFSTNNKVWGIQDTGSPDPMLVPEWPPVSDIQTPETVLHWTSTKYLYVGGGDGKLYQIDVDSGSFTSPPLKTSVLLEANTQIGAPSLDGPNGLVLVGSVTGVIYAVRVPLP